MNRYSDIKLLNIDIENLNKLNEQLNLTNTDLSCEVYNSNYTKNNYTNKVDILLEEKEILEKKLSDLNRS